MGRGVCGPPGDGLKANGPETRGATRAGLGQRGRSGRIGIGPQRPAGQGFSQGVVMNRRQQMRRRDTEDWRNIHGGAAAEAVAAARKSVVMAVLMKRRLSVVVGMLLGAGLVVSIVQMKRSMGIAADQSERQQ